MSGRAADEAGQPVSGQIVRVNSRAVVEAARQDLEAFESLMLNSIDRLGLPTEGIIVDVREREKLLRNAEDALDKLDDEQRARASYISKMMMAASVGLFDAALTYLWDETISELRKRVAAFDVEYFFDLAEPDPAKRKGLRTPEDLPKLDDSKLMEAAAKIQLISNIGYRQLDHIRYMRNYASSAHPTDVSLTGLNLVAWLETCIREVITLPHATVVAEIGRLLYNIKTKRMSQNELDIAAAFFDNLPLEQADNLAAGLFGIYNPPDASPDTQDNVRNLWPDLWPYVGEDKRIDFGVKLARFRANGDTDRATRARELLDLVDGTAYLADTERKAELSQALDDLIAAHEGWDNFSNEPPVARRLQALVGKHGQVPDGFSTTYVRQLIYVFLTNGHGKSWAADPIYKELIGTFDSAQAGIARRTFADSTISSRLQRTLAREKWAELLDLIEPKLTGRRDRTLLDTVRAFSGTPDRLILDSEVKRQLGVVRKPRSGTSRRPGAKS